MPNRISESELVLPSLYLMQLNDGAITTTELIKNLRLILRPIGEDLDMLSGRSDDKFSQKVRNLKSHRAFEKIGYARYNENGCVSITTKGKRHLDKNQEFLKYLLTNDFKYSDIKQSLESIKEDSKKILVFDENIAIQEGIKQVSRVNIYSRSVKLRNYAIEFFTQDNRINCQCYLFDFEKFYGTEIGKGFIEIHHNRPIFQYEDSDINATIKQAITNLTPVCSNCHRMIHRKKSEPLTIKYLKNQILLQQK